MGARVEKFFDKARSRRRRHRRRVGGRCRFGFRETASRALVAPVETHAERIQSRYRQGIERSNSPVDEGWWLRRLQHDAGQIDVAPAFDVELRIAADLCLRDCTRDRTKLKWFLAGRAGPERQSSARARQEVRSRFSLKPPQSCNQPARALSVRERARARNRLLRNSPRENKRLSEIAIRERAEFAIALKYNPTDPARPSRAALRSLMTTAIASLISIPPGALLPCEFVLSFPREKSFRAKGLTVSLTFHPKPPERRLFRSLRNSLGSGWLLIESY